MEGSPILRTRFHGFSGFILSLLLVAYGAGFNSAAADEHALFEQELTITEDNAVALAALVHELAISGFGVTPGEIPNIDRADRAGVLSAYDARALVTQQLERWGLPTRLSRSALTETVPCEVSGTTTVTLDDADRLSVRFDACDEGEGEVLDGTLVLSDVSVRRPARGEVHVSATFTFDALRISYHDETPPLTSNGTLALVRTEDHTIFRVTDRLTGNLTIEEGVDPDAIRAAGFEDADMVWVENWTAGWSALLDWETTIASLRAGSSDMGGYVEIATAAPAGGDAHEACPLRGIVRAAGAQDSALAIHYGADAGGSVDLHLNDAPLASFATCEDFLTALE